MTVRKANLPAEVRKPDNRTVQTADQVIAEIAAKIAPYKPKPEWEGMSPEEMFERGKNKWDGIVGYDPEEKEYAEAAKWYRRAAEQGHAKAQMRLGGLHHVGLGVPHDWTLAAKWYRRAAEQGLARAQFLLGGMYQEGERPGLKGVPQDYAEAAKWYRRAAERGDADAQEELARILPRVE